MRGLFVVLLGSLVASCGGADQLDVRCYAAASVNLAASRGNGDAATLMSYYLGRVDAVDPSGGWAEAAGKQIGEFNRDPSQMENLLTSCVDRMRSSMAKQRTAIEATKADR
ncbi:MAG: hypothetical protein IBJ02_04665 [Brevundimonas sp.]|nr:hypothetical protein [Brevundimonas sp.]